jgi:hypothetical protein
VVPPEVPGGRPVGQAVFDDQADGQGDDAVGVVAARWGEVRQIGAEVRPAAGAVVPGIHHAQVTRPVAEEATHIMQDTPADVVAVAPTAAAWAGAAALVARAGHDHGPGQVFDTRDPLSAIRDIRARCHRSVLQLPTGHQTAQHRGRNTSRLPAFVATVSKESMAPHHISRVRNGQSHLPPGRGSWYRKGTSSRRGLRTP